MEPLGVHHVSVNVSDAARALGFYVEVLGGKERTDRPAFGFGGAWIDFGGQQVHLIEAAAVPGDLGQHFAIRVADLDSAVEELRGRGVDVSEPMAVGTGRQSFLKDPDGNGIELHQVAS